MQFMALLPVAVGLSLSGCGQGSSNNASGRDLFVSAPGNVGFQVLWCSTCHKIDSVSGSIGGIGPDLTNIGTDAATRLPGLSAQEYIKQSIIDPGAFVVEGYPNYLMTLSVTGSLTDQQVDALVDFLLTQK